MWAGENQTPWGYTGPWGEAVRGPRGAPGGPPGPGGVHFRGYLITLPVGTKWIFGFFGFFALGHGIPPMVHPHTPQDTPQDTPHRPPQDTPPEYKENSIRTPKNPPKSPSQGSQGGSPEAGPGAPPGGPRAPGPRARARGAPGGPGGPPGGPPRGGPRTPLPGGIFPPPTGGDITGRVEVREPSGSQDRRGTGDRSRRPWEERRRSPDNPKGGVPQARGNWTVRGAIATGPAAKPRKRWER